MIPILLITISNTPYLNKQVFLFDCNHNNIYKVKFNQLMPMLIWVTIVHIIVNILKPLTYP